MRHDSHEPLLNVRLFIIIQKMLKTKRKKGKRTAEEAKEEDDAFVKNLGETI